MGRFLLLLFTLILAIYAQSLIANAENMARYILRDGLILSAIAAFIFGLGVRSTSQPDSLSSSESSHKSAPFTTSLTILWLVVLLALGVVVRYWALEALPAQCVGTECATLMRLADPEALAADANATNSTADHSITGFASTQPPILFAMMQQVHEQVETPVQAIRWTGVAIGVLTLLAFFLFASQIVQIPVALVLMALMIQLPWHVWASATGDNRITLPLFICAAGWLALSGLRHAGLRQQSAIAGTLLWFVGAGITIGAMQIEAGLLQLAPTLWLILLLLITVVLLWSRGIGHSIVGGGGLIIGFGATLAIATSSGLAPRAMDGASLLAALGSSNPLGPNTPVASGGVQWFVQNLFYRGDFGPAGNLFDEPILGLLLGGLVVTGLAVIIVGSIEGNRKSALYLAVLVGLVAAGGAMWMANHSGAIDPLTDAPASRLLILLPFLFILAALSLDQIFDAFQSKWSPLVDGRQLTLALLGIALIGPALTMSNVLDSFGAVTARGENPLDPLLIEYLSRELPAHQDGSVTFLAPADFVESPTTGLQLGAAFDAAVDSGQLRPFNPSEDLLFINRGPGDLVYLLDGNDRSLVELMSQLFPDSMLESQSNTDPNDEAQLVALRVSMESILANQGLRLALYEGNDTTAIARQPVFIQNQTPPTSNWDRLPINGEFSVEWTGTLLVPQSGQYFFQAQGHPDANLGLTLDNINVLDTGNGLNTGNLVLARGPYRIQVRYRSETISTGGQPSAFQLMWQPPDKELTEIPLSLLQTQLPPNAGLLGSYYAGERFEQPELLFQKDLLIGMDADLPEPYSILWRGKLGASRAGEYLLGVLTSGRAALSVNGRMVVDAMSVIPEAASVQSESEEGESNDSGRGEDSQDDRTYVEGLVYLRQGWHDIEIAYIPDQGQQGNRRDGLELFWVPPGGLPDTLPSSILAPYLGRVSMLDYSLPLAPPLRAPHLGNNQFSLSLPQRGAAPQVSFAAERLSAVNMSPVWQTQNGCGSGPEQFLAPHGVAIDPDSGLVYVADTENQRIVQLDSEGLIEESYDGSLLPEPFDVAMQFRPDIGRHQLLVLDATSQTILRLDPAATSLDPFVPLALNTAFYRPRGFDVDANGNIAVADTGGARVVLLTPDGDLMFEAGGRETALGIGQPADALAISGQLWAITAEDGRLWKVTGNADESGSLAAVTKTDTLNGPRLAALNNGGIFVADPVRGLVVFHRPDGQPLNQLDHPSIIKPVGIDIGIVDDVLYMALADGSNCSVSLWQLDRAMFGL